MATEPGQLVFREKNQSQRDNSLPKIPAASSTLIQVLDIGTFVVFPHAPYIAVGNKFLYHSFNQQQMGTQFQGFLLPGMPAILRYFGYPLNLIRLSEKTYT